MDRNAIIVSLVLGLVACGSGEEDARKGYSDGYAVGYNRLCHPDKTNIIHGLDSPKYRDGYADGYADGEADCRAAR